MISADAREINLPEVKRHSFCVSSLSGLVCERQWKGAGRGGSGKELKFFAFWAGETGSGCSD